MADVLQMVGSKQGDARHSIEDNDGHLDHPDPYLVTISAQLVYFFLEDQLDRFV